MVYTDASVSGLYERFTTSPKLFVTDTSRSGKGLPAKVVSQVLPPRYPERSDLPSPLKSPRTVFPAVAVVPVQLPQLKPLPFDKHTFHVPEAVCADRSAFPSP